MGEEELQRLSYSASGSVTLSGSASCDLEMTYVRWQKSPLLQALSKQHKTNRNKSRMKAISL